MECAGCKYFERYIDDFLNRYVCENLEELLNDALAKKFSNVKALIVKKIALKVELADLKKQKQEIRKYVLDSVKKDIRDEMRHLQERYSTGPAGKDILNVRRDIAVLKAEFREMVEKGNGEN